ncbi:hypothetical protein KAFR_0H01350 [Kazachstania africana CBS 2517]|uniref:VLRF1 domain-containing protein n=1 Tax=Kazachstania africana (strain ATCC 22294 / BCRC 22015 / CBS 2517 / CECT 1963 / NBRC 1671 / NRRL Y-8276) TaxID=1071382 RepID=H2AYY9_KAZAF|nr:hypothetical protein KAFR_0H01350 [Kazachstania africana CBS 2517]CCF59545.1 hypothetical protein KAFR_0H01350 [Kazachstania africana CBS 2517]
MSEAKFRKNDLYVYDLSGEVRTSLHLMSFDQNLNECDAVAVEPSILDAIPIESKIVKVDQSANKFHCNACNLDFENQLIQRKHYQAEFHTLNIKRSLRNLPPITYDEYDTSQKKYDPQEETSLTDIKETSEESSDDGSDSTESETDEEFENEFNEKINIFDDLSSSKTVSHLSTKSSQIYYKSNLLADTEAFGIYKNIFSLKQLDHPTSAINSWNEDLEYSSNAISALFMIGGGHFAGAIVSHQRMKIGSNFNRGKNSKDSLQEHAVIFLEHKTFHRYTTRRKQGGSQSAMDNAKGKANSAGSTLRRYNEAALKTDVQSLLKEWQPYLEKCENIYIRARNANDRRLFIEEPSTLDKHDARIKSFPFTTNRPTIHELKKAWCELTYLKTVPKPKPEPVKKTEVKKEVSKTEAPKQDRALQELSPEEKHTEELVSLLKKGRAPLLIAYLRKSKVDVNVKLEPESKYMYTPTMLHYASQNGHKRMINVLLSNLRSDPRIKNIHGRTAYDLSKNETIRQEFQIARYNLGEHFTNWGESHVGEPLSREEVGEINKMKEENDRKETESLIQKELEAAKERQKLEKEAKRGPGHRLDGGKLVSIEQNLNSLTDEQRRKLMREQRARAAEARLRQNK